jgi:sec-independent protein translocase protein TatA
MDTLLLNTFRAAMGWQQILIVAIVILLLFGGKKIPELMKGLGKGMKEFKDASKDKTDDSSSTDLKKD